MEINICKQDGCKSKAAYGAFKGDRQYCIKHKLHRMLFYKSIAFCDFKGCTKRGTFRDNDRNLRLCATHRYSDTAQNNYKKICSAYGCEITASFGFPGSKVEKCGTHREPGQINLTNYILCKHPQCNKIIRRSIGTKNLHYCLEHLNPLDRLPVEDSNIDCMILQDVNASMLYDINLSDFNLPDLKWSYLDIDRFINTIDEN